jgi:hypothetical protein
MSVYVDLEISESGEVALSGQELSSAPNGLLGGSGYEYWLTVPSAEKDRFIVALLL